jgi:ADP-ribose pyrophosphatase YjhB (NUDIX family)
MHLFLYGQDVLALADALLAVGVSVTGIGEQELLRLEERLAQAGLRKDDCSVVTNDRTALLLARGARVRGIALSPTLAQEAELTFATKNELLDWVRRQLQIGARHWPVATVGGLVFRGDEAFFVRTAKWSNKWGTPGGKIEYGEPFRSAFLREIREETGLSAREPRLVFVDEGLEDPDFMHPRHFIFLNLCARYDFGEVRLNHELLEGRWLSLPRAAALELNRPTRALIEYLHAHPNEVPAP